MFGSEILEVAIALVFLYFTLSVVCSAVTEVVASLTKLRAKNLRESLQIVLGSKDAKDFYEHALIRGLGRKNKADEPMPSYISSWMFSSVVLGMWAAPTQPQANPQQQAPHPPANPPQPSQPQPPQPAAANSPGLLASLRHSIAQHPSSPVARALAALLVDAQDNAADIRTRLEHWFNDSMERASGRYKRKSQVILFLSAVVVACATNADTLRVASEVTQDPKLREQILQSAIAATAAPPASAQPIPTPKSPPSQTPATAPTTAPATDTPEPDLTTSLRSAVDDLTEAVKQMNLSTLPLGWSDQPLPHDGFEWVTFSAQKLVGLLITALSVGMGAPFWFDLLNRLVNLRSNGRPPEVPESKTQGASNETDPAKKG
jgi:hypothetical protein